MPAMMINQDARTANVQRQQGLMAAGALVGALAASSCCIRKVKTDLHRFCPISKVVRNSGTELEEVWNVTRP
jgi:hypothetical protein